MESLPLPVLAELLSMLPYKDLIKFERLSRTLRSKLTQNTSLIAAFINIRCEVPTHVRVVQASFTQLKGVLRTIDPSRSEGIVLQPVHYSRGMQVNNLSTGTKQCFIAALGYSSVVETHVVTSLSLYKAISSKPFTTVLFVSYDLVSSEEADEHASLFAQAQTSEAVMELERAGVVTVTACYDYEADWKALFLRSTYSDKLRPVLWVQAAANFGETITVAFSKPLLARYTYLYTANQRYGEQVHLSMRGAPMNLTSS